MPYYPGPGRPGDITRIADINQKVLLQSTGQWWLYRVQGYESIQPSAAFIVDFGAIGAGAVSADTDLQTPLEMSTFELGQFRMRCLDDIRVSILLPRQTARWGMRRALSRVTLRSRIEDSCGHLTEFYFYDINSQPFANAVNPSDYNILVSRVMFWGYRYRVDKIAGPFALADLPKIGDQFGPFAAVMGEALLRGGSEG